MLNIELIKTRGEVYMLDNEEMVVLTDVDAKVYRKSKMGRFVLSGVDLIENIEETREVLAIQGFEQL